MSCNCKNVLFIFYSPVQAQSSDPLKTKHQLDLERSYFLVTQAFEEDEKGNSDEAIELYTQAVELCIQAVSSVLCTLCIYPITFDLKTFSRKP